MSKFIKLTKACGGSVWIRKDAISSITEGKEKTIIYVCETLSPWEVEESVEYILEQLGVKGKWRPYGDYDDTDFVYVYTCSICGETGIPAFNFCPNCGADMREEEKDGEI